MTLLHQEIANENHQSAGDDDDNCSISVSSTTPVGTSTIVSPTKSQEDYDQSDSSMSTNSLTIHSSMDTLHSSINATCSYQHGPTSMETIKERLSKLTVPSISSPLPYSTDVFGQSLSSLDAWDEEERFEINNRRRQISSPRQKQLKRRSQLNRIRSSPGAKCVAPPLARYRHSRYLAKLKQELPSISLH